MKLKEYNVVDEGQQTVQIRSIKQLANQFDNNKFWAEMATSKGEFMVSSTVEYVLRTVLGKQHAITFLDLSRLCNKCCDVTLIPDELAQDVASGNVKSKPTEMTFKEKILFHADRLHFCLQKVCLGNDYAVMTCTTKSQAKKVAKMLKKHFTANDRHKKDVLFLD